MYRVRRAFTYDGQAYPVGAEIAAGTLAGWRNGHLLIKQRWVLPAGDAPATGTAKRK
jgi:hypothetical protein